MGINDVTGFDIEQEQLAPGCVGLAQEAFPEWVPIRAPFAIMGHVPPCMQHPQVHADRHEPGAPSTRNDTWKELHRPRANSSVQKKPLITILLV